jgi:metal-responsive CopG/Arc/MetJ family transcriptional regulator
MRTTVTLADDVAAAVERVRREQAVGTSEAVNELIRKGLAAGAQREEFRQRSHRLGLRLDVSNVADALETLDGPTAR